MPRPNANDSYSPISGRRKLLILLLGVSTALGLIYMMLNRTGAPPLKRVDSARCAPGQSTDCVGGRAQVIVVAPAASSASSVPPASAASR